MHENPLSTETDSAIMTLLQRALALRRLSSKVAATGRTTRSLSSYVLTDAEKQWQSQGILDERGLVAFDTLHNMQVRSCQVFSDKNLFSTYSEETKDFEWMTFAECE